MIQLNRLVRTVLLACLLCPLAQALAQTAPAPLAAASAEAALTVRQEIGLLLQEAQRLLVEGKGSAAADTLRAAQALADRTPYEQHVLARLTLALAGLNGDAELAAQQFELASLGPWLTPADKRSALQTVAGLHYNAKQYGKAIDWARRYQLAGGLDATVTTLLMQSYYLAGDYANAARALQAELDKALAAGKAPPEMQLRLLADSQSRLKDEAGYSRSLEALVQHYPSPASWRALLARLWAKPQLAPRLHLNLFRLQLASAGLSDAGDYSEMAELALQEGSAIEASQLLEQGYAGGVLPAGERALQVLRDKLGAAAAQDRKTLEADLVRARTMPDGLALFNYGFNLFHSGQGERGLTQMEQALAKGIARNGDLARLRLVAAYAQAKQRDKAQQLLGSMNGKGDLVGYEEILRYWKLFLR